MFRNKVRRTLLVTGLGTASIALLPLTSASAAQPPDVWYSRTTGITASTNWTEVDPIATGVSPLGNTHVGHLEAEGKKQKSVPVTVFGFVEDYDCDPGETPGGGHGIPGETGVCDLVGSRQIEAKKVTLTLDAKKFSTARLTGTLTVSSGHGEGPTANPKVDITWTGTGNVITTKTKTSYDDGIIVLTTSEVRKGRVSTVEGTIGPMNFTDDADDVSDGFIGSYKVVARGRTKSTSNLVTNSVRNSAGNPVSN